MYMYILGVSTYASTPPSSNGLTSGEIGGGGGRLNDRSCAP